MKEDRTTIILVTLALLSLAGFLLWTSGVTADRTVTTTFAPYSAGLVKARQEPLGIVDLVRAHKVNGQMWPKWVYPATGKPCGTDCKAWADLKAAKVGRAALPLPWVAGAGGVLLVAGLLCGVVAFAPNPRRNLINYRRDKIRLRTRGDTLPIIRQGSAQWGLMRRPDLKGSGRRQFGNGIFLGQPGTGKSNLLKAWLLTSDTLNFLVVDLKGDLWNETAGHRATLGKVIRLNLSSMEGDALDPFSTDQKADVMGLFEILLPTDEPRTVHFNRAAQQIAAAYWSAARQAGRSTVPVLVQAATSITEDMLSLARELASLAPEHRRAQVLADFRGAFAEVWENPDKGNGGEKGSVLSSFRAAFAGLNTPEILSTLAARTFDPAKLVEGRATLYITAPGTEAPYRAPLELLLGAVVDEIFAYCDAHGAGEEIVILADEAGELKMPRFKSILATGRSRNVTLTAFLQDVGQLRQYHPDGWQGITDTIHHWTFWEPKNMDARKFLREMCGVFDAPNPDYDREKRNRRFIEVNAFDDLGAQWHEDKVISLLKYDRTYVVYGEFVTPFKGPAKARRRLSPPKLRALPAPSLLVAPIGRQLPPAPLASREGDSAGAGSHPPQRPASPRLPPRTVQPRKLEETDEDETF